MRLDFNVLWVDDQPARVEAQIRAIARGMADEGFSFNPTLCQNLEELRPRLAGDVFTDEVDLVLVDWDLGGGVEGQHVIAEVREKIRYKDVVFYSAQTPPDRLRELAYNAGLEGVYCAERGNLIDEVVGVFESLVKKVLDLDHTRGIVMGATSDIDDTINQCLVAIHDKLDATEQQALVNDALQLIVDRIASLSDKAAALRAQGTMVAIFEAHFLFTANDRLRILSHVLKRKTFDAHRGARKSVATYMGKVVPERNILGHQILSPQGKPTAVVDASGKQMGLKELRDLRRLILDLRTDFRNLLQALHA